MHHGQNSLPSPAKQHRIIVTGQCLVCGQITGMGMADYLDADMRLMCRCGEEIDVDKDALADYLDAALIPPKQAKDAI